MASAREQLDNRGGKIVGDSGLDITTPRMLQPGQGVLASRDGLRLSATGVVQRRGGGLLSSQKGIDVSWPVRSITRPAAWTAGGFLTVKSARLDNQGGTLSSGGIGSDQPGRPEQSGRQTGERRRT